MPSQNEKAKALASFHVKGSPLILFNAWDAGTAAAAAKAGARAVATGSWSVAAAHGFGDGESLPLDLAVASLERIVAAVELPVTIDLESGYGRAPESVAVSVARVIAAGAVGFNLEDQVIGGEGLYAVADQAARVAAAREACRRAGVEAWLNARTDLFLKAPAASHDGKLLDQALERAAAYAKAGASGFFAPGLVDEGLIGRLCESSPLPVNLLIFPNIPPNRRLAELGVARISYGPWPYRTMMKSFEDAARDAHGSLG
jgi:2-methylisocitrate lyase-like PEP mutase family enzyme